MIELNNYEQQIILACKGWSEWSKVEDRLKAVKVVLSQYYDLDEDDLSYAMYDCLLNLFCKAYDNNINQLKRFTLGIFQAKWTAEFKQEISKMDIVQNLISELNNIRVLDENNERLFELKPDYSILNRGLIKKKM